MASQDSSTSCGNGILLGQLDFLKVGEKCARFVAYLFPKATDHLLHPASATWSYFPRYVAYVLRRSRFDTVIVIAAMVLLQRYSEVVEIANDTEMYGLFLSSFIVASQSMDRPSYALDSWSLIGGEIFSVDDVVDLVQEFCQSLDWDIHIDLDVLIRFISILHEDVGLFGDHFVANEPLPSYEERHRDIKIFGSDFTPQPLPILR